MRNIEVQTNFSIIRNYYNQINSQTGIKSIKKKMFGNLLNMLIAQERLLPETEKRLIERGPLLLWEKSGLLIDVTSITKNDLSTGIQRMYL